MNTIGRLLCLAAAGLLLTGCVEQEVQIKLNADGSGTLALTRHLSDMESGVALLGEEVPPTLAALSLTRQALQDSTTPPGRKIQISEYAFSNLAEALPELENLVPLMPRFSVQSNQLTVAVRHEMNEYHGFSSEDATNAFYNLTIEFPEPPQSETGLVKGNSVSWKADAQQLKAFQKSDIGSALFECSLSASAVQLNLKPRLVEYEKQKKITKPKEVKLVSALDLKIPVVVKGNRWTREDSNTTLGLYLPIDPNRLPLCYEGLKVDRLTIAGQTVVPELTSETDGVFSGTDTRGQEAAGIPIQLKFGWNSPILNQIDRIDVSMNAAVPAKTSIHTLNVDSAAATNAVMNFPRNPNERIAILELNHKFWQTAKLKLVTNLNPTDLSMVYLDTNYGLRYPAKGIEWKRGKNIRSDDRELGENIFGKDAPFSIVEIHYPHIPTTSFALTFEKTEELTMEELILSEENIHVY